MTLDIIVEVEYWNFVHQKDSRIFEVSLDALVNHASVVKDSLRPRLDSLLRKSLAPIKSGAETTSYR